MLLCTVLGYGQQTEEFRQMKSYFSTQRGLLQKEFVKNINLEKDSLNREEMKQYYSLFMVKLDSAENKAYLNALIRTRNREDLDAIKQENKAITIATKGNVIMPEYPGGLDQLRSEVSHLFYTDAFKAQEGILKTKIGFTVNTEGNVSFVDAEGTSVLFNIQAAIALYRLEGTFTPATLDGAPVSFRYTIPISLKFE